MNKEKRISEETICNHLRYDLPRVDVRREITSTNTVLKELAASGAPEWYLLTSEEQTAGRGRLGRSFASPSKTGIYMSLLLKGEKILENPAEITATAAVAVSSAIQKVCGVETGIKWVNDLFVSGKKVCGILAEGSTGTSVSETPFVVLGIGVNLFKPKMGFGDLSHIADGILPYREDTAELRGRLIAEISNEFLDRYTQGNAVEVYSEYKRKLMILGKEVCFRRGEGTLTVRVIDLDSDFRLLVEHPSGEREYLQTGEISIISF